MTGNRIKQLYEREGQSAWQDDISRDMLNQGAIRTAIEETGIRGLTSNPTIFEKVIAAGKPLFILAEDLAQMTLEVDVDEADVDWDEPGEPKTGPRSVPIPPELVATLRTWIADHELSGSDLLFRTRTGRRPAPSNWARALQRACRAVGREPIRVYDCRHACATTWLRAGVPLGEVARRLGHSVETLVTTYVGALEGDDVAANNLIDTATAGSRSWLLEQAEAEEASPVQRPPSRSIARPPRVPGLGL